MPSWKELGLSRGLEGVEGIRKDVTMVEGSGKRAALRENPRPSPL